MVGFGSAGLAGAATAGLQPVVSQFRFPGGAGRGGWARTLVGMGHDTEAQPLCVVPQIDVHPCRIAWRL